MEEKEINDKKDGSTMLENLYNIIIIGAMVITLFLFEKPVLQGVRMAFDGIASVIEGMGNDAVGGLYLFFGMFFVPILLFAIVGFTVAYLFLILITIYKIKNLKTAEWYEFFILIVLYIANSIMEGIGYEAKNIQYYLSGVAEYGVLIGIILLVVILILRKKQETIDKSKTDN